jgi:hypothetical protein
MTLENRATLAQFLASNLKFPFRQLRLPDFAVFSIHF